MFEIFTTEDKKKMLHRTKVSMMAKVQDEMPISGIVKGNSNYR